MTKVKNAVQLYVPSGAVAMAYVLLAIYLLPSVVFLGELFRTAALSESFVLTWFFALANDKSMAMSELHQLILPVITAMSVASLKSEPGPAAWLMLGACLGGFVLILGAQVMLDVTGYRVALEGLGFTGVEVDGARTFLGSQRTNLLLYFSVMAGLKAGG